MTELEFARNELDYWIQIVEDNEKTTLNLSNINDQVDGLIGLAAMLVDNDETLYAVTVLSIIRNIQESLENSFTLQEEQNKLVRGRLKMIRTDLGLKEDDG